MERTYSEKIIWQKFKIEIKKHVFLESGVKVSAVLTRGLDIHSCKFDDLGPGFPLDLLFLWAFMQTSSTSKGSFMIHNNLWFQIQKYKNWQFAHILQSLQQSSTFQKDSPYSCALEGFSSPSVPTIRVPFDPWKARSPWQPQNPCLSPHSCHVRSHGWSPSRRWWSESQGGFSIHFPYPP